MRGLRVQPYPAAKPRGWLVDAARGLLCHSLLAATASQEAAFTCPALASHRAKQEIQTAPRKQRIISFGSLLPDWSSPKCLVFTADGFWFEMCVSVFGTSHWMWACPGSNSQQKPHELQQEQAHLMAHSLEILFSTQRGFPKLDGINGIAAGFW